MEYDSHSTVIGTSALHPSVSEELVVNPGFDDSSIWTEGVGWSISGGEASYTGASQGLLLQPISLIQGADYFVTYEITSITSGTITPILGGISGNARSSVGTTTEEIIAGPFDKIEFFPSVDFVGSIDFVRVQQFESIEHVDDTEFVDFFSLWSPGLDWSIDNSGGGSASKSAFGPETQATSAIRQTLPKIEGSPFLENRTYLVTYELANVRFSSTPPPSGTPEFYANLWGTAGTVRSVDGVFSAGITTPPEFVASPYVEIVGTAKSLCDVLSVSVIENKLDPDLIIDGEFPSNSQWSTTGSWAVGSNRATKSPGTAGDVFQSLADLVSGEPYRVQYTVSNFQTGSVTAVLGGTSGTPVSKNGVFSEFIVAGSGNLNIALTADSSTDLVIDDLTVLLESSLEIIDTEGFGSLEWIIQSGNITGEVSIRLLEGDEFDGSDGVPVSPEHIIGGIPEFGLDDDNTVKTVGVVSKKRFQQLIFEDTSGGDTFNAIALLGNALVAATPDSAGLTEIFMAGTRFADDTSRKKKGKIMPGKTLKCKENGKWALAIHDITIATVGDIIHNVPELLATRLVESGRAEYVDIKVDVKKKKVVEEDSAADSVASEEKTEISIEEEKIEVTTEKSSKPKRRKKGDS